MTRLSLGLGALFGLALLTAALFSLPAHACAIEDCSSPAANGLTSACFNLSGAKWCNRTSGYNPPFSGWTEVRVVDHTRYAALTAQAAGAWDYPPVGNSLWLHLVDASQPHEIDIWEAQNTDWWFGYTYPQTQTGNAACYAHVSISLNVTQLSKQYATWQLWTIEHELGHAVGLRHVCACSAGRVMNPCTECIAPSTISSCDGQGAWALYH